MTVKWPLDSSLPVADRRTSVAPALQVVSNKFTCTDLEWLRLGCFSGELHFPSIINSPHRIKQDWSLSFVVCLDRLDIVLEAIGRYGAHVYHQRPAHLSEILGFRAIVGHDRTGSYSETDVCSKVLDNLGRMENPEISIEDGDKEKKGSTPEASQDWSCYDLVEWSLPQRQ